MRYTATQFENWYLADWQNLYNRKVKLVTSKLYHLNGKDQSHFIGNIVSITFPPIPNCLPNKIKLLSGEQEILIAIHHIKEIEVS